MEMEAGLFTIPLEWQLSGATQAAGAQRGCCPASTLTHPGSRGLDLQSAEVQTGEGGPDG